MQWHRWVCTAIAAAPALAPMPAAAADGLTPPAADALWPRWQARISVQTAAVSPLSLSQLVERTPAPRTVQGAALLGDYTFARPSFGAFRASGGILIGRHGGVPLLDGGVRPRLGWSLQSAAGAGGGAADAPAALPYLGVGFSGGLWHDAVTLSADLGLVAGGSVGRALFGNQGADSALRELRLAPVLQLGVRYTF